MSNHSNKEEYGADLSVVPVIVGEAPGLPVLQRDIGRSPIFGDEDRV
jgi:hypothetical protein